MDLVEGWHPPMTQPAVVEFVAPQGSVGAMRTPAHLMESVAETALGRLRFIENPPAFRWGLGEDGKLWIQAQSAPGRWGAIQPQLWGLSRRLDTQPYVAQHMRQLLHERFPGCEIVSTTLPPNVNRFNLKLAGGEKILGTGENAIRIVFDQRGFPIFDRFAKFDTKIPRDLALKASDRAHKRAATRDLREAIQRGEVSPHGFTKEQLADINKGVANINDLTWHHHQDIGRMQLIPFDLHQKVGHIAGFKLSNVAAGRKGK